MGFGGVRWNFRLLNPFDWLRRSDFTRFQGPAQLRNRFQGLQVARIRGPVAFHFTLHAKDFGTWPGLEVMHLSSFGACTQCCFSIVFHRFYIHNRQSVKDVKVLMGFQPDSAPPLFKWQLTSEASWPYISAAPLLSMPFAASPGGNVGMPCRAPCRAPLT